MNRRILGFLCIIILLQISCKDEVKTPKVIYEKHENDKKTTANKEQSQILVSDLPVQIPGTDIVVYPIGQYNVADASTKSKYSGDNASFVVSNASEYEITGYLSNIKFQKIGSDSLCALTDKDILIESVTYLNTIATKLKKNYLVYIAEDTDSNRDGKVDTNDIKDIFISDANGSSFIKLSSSLQEVIDWNVIESQNKLYFRTIEDINKNGAFDKDDTVHYHYVDLSQKIIKVIDYNPIN